jgi:hypothetical protein
MPITGIVAAALREGFRVHFRFSIVDNCRFVIFDLLFQSSITLCRSSGDRANQDRIKLTSGGFWKRTNRKSQIENRESEP